MTIARTILHKNVFLHLIPNLGEIVAPSLFWYIEGAYKHSLVATGGTGEELRKNSQFGSAWEDVRPFEDCLAHVGITPDDVDIVIQTCLHFDRTLNTRKCRNAKVYMQKIELMQAEDPHTLTARMYSWFAQGGKNLDYVAVNGDYGLLPGIDLFSISGHSAGC